MKHFTEHTGRLLVVSVYQSIHIGEENLVNCVPFAKLAKFSSPKFSVLTKIKQQSLCVVSYLQYSNIVDILVKSRFGKFASNYLFTNKSLLCGIAIREICTV